MITLPSSTYVDARFQRLHAFAREILAICDELDIDPFIDGSVAVQAYAQDAAITIHDVDLNCSEADFPRLHAALISRGIRSEITTWHVLQARRDDLKVEFGATEFWMQDITPADDRLQFGDRTLSIVGLDDLRDLYRRGVEETRGLLEHRAKHEDCRRKLSLLDALSAD